MEYIPVNGLEIRMNFYISSGCVLEDVIENYFYNYFKKACLCVHGRKESIAGCPTDGIIRFYNENNELLFWALQETKRDKGISSIDVPRSFLQSLMYIANIYYYTNPTLGLDNFRGIFLNSARYFCFVPRETVDEVMKEFKPLWEKYIKVSPSKAYKEDELDFFARLRFHTSKIYKFELNNSFRLDLLLKDMYENKI